MNDLLQYLDEKIDLYHAPFVGMAFDFEKNTLELRFLDYDDLAQIYVPLILLLKGLRSFASDYPQDVDFVPTNCYSLAVERLGDRVRFSFVCMLSHSPVWKLTVECTGLEITGGLSPEAQAHREAYFQQMMREEGGEQSS